MRRRWLSGLRCCSFCGKPQNQVRKLISTPKGRSPAYICDKCVAICNTILEKQSGPPLGPNVAYRVAQDQELHKESWFERVKSWWKYGIIDQAVFKQNQ